MTATVNRMDFMRSPNEVPRPSGATNGAKLDTGWSSRRFWMCCSSGRARAAARALGGRARQEVSGLAACTKGLLPDASRLSPQASGRVC
jgi:hypothetical protein